MAGEEERHRHEHPRIGGRQRVSYRWNGESPELTGFFPVGLGSPLGFARAEVTKVECSGEDSEYADGMSEVSYIGGDVG